MEDRAAKLLLKAVRMLPQREQDQVLTALLKEAFADPVPFTRPLPSTVPRDVVMLSEPSPMLLTPPGGMPGPAAMLPVRLPPELHERLRRWSTDQGFSMAGVVRGLVERFLDEQSGRVRARQGTAKSRSKGSATARG